MVRVWKGGTCIWGCLGRESGGEMRYVGRRDEICGEERHMDLIGSGRRGRIKGS